MVELLATQRVAVRGFHRVFLFAWTGKVPDDKLAVMKTVAVIPAYNEEKRVFQAISDAFLFVDDVVVVDDCSRDATGERAQAGGAHVLRHIVNRGQGAALQTGTDYALSKLSADIVVHFDADGQMQGKDIKRLVTPILDGTADIVLGSRFMGTDAENMPASRRATLKAALALTRLLSGLAISDPHCGFRALSASAARVARFRQDRMAHASEMHDLIKSKKLRHAHVPVEIRYSEETLAKGMTFVDGFAVLREYFKDRFFDTL